MLCVLRCPMDGQADNVWSPHHDQPSLTSEGRQAVVDGPASIHFLGASPKRLNSSIHTSLAHLWGPAATACTWTISTNTTHRGWRFINNVSWVMCFHRSPLKASIIHSFPQTSQIIQPYILSEGMTGPQRCLESRLVLIELRARITCTLWSLGITLLHQVLDICCTIEMRWDLEGSEIRFLFHLSRSKPLERLVAPGLIAKLTVPRWLLVWVEHVEPAIFAIHFTSRMW